MIMRVELKEVTILLAYIVVLFGILSKSQITILVGIFLILGRFYADWRGKNKAE